MVSRRFSFTPAVLPPKKYLVGKKTRVRIRKLISKRTKEKSKKKSLHQERSEGNKKESQGRGS